MDSFILRVYRRDENDPEHLVGTVEDVGTQEQAIFHDMNDLQRLLNQTQQKDLDSSTSNPKKLK